jgi:hypothetical protein
MTRRNTVLLLFFLCMHVGCGGGAEDAPDATDAPDAVDARTDDTTTSDILDHTDSDSRDVSDDPDADAEAESKTLASDISITTIRAFQTVESTLVESGTRVTPGIPLVAGRDTLVQVMVETAGGWTARELTAELVLTDDGDDAPTVITDTRTVSGSSRSDHRDSVFEFLVDRDQLTAPMSVSVRVLGDSDVAVDSQTSSNARWPNDGSLAALDVTDATGELHLVLVPFRYDADGSGRLPDTSESQLELIENALRALYPATDLRLDVRETVAWDSWLDFGDINRELRTLKQQDGASEAYYYGMIRPAETFADYCSGTCTTGQSFTVSSADAASYRVGSGVGFSGERWAWTLVHELGHMHGRGHAPCGVSWWSADGDYPHNDGNIGVQAWDARTDDLLGPQDATDFMGYCDTLWASDYTYLGIMERMRAVNARRQTLALGPARAWQYVNWSDDARPAWGQVTRERDPFSGEWARAAFLDPNGDVVQTRRIPFIRYAHGGERSVLVPEPPSHATYVRIRGGDASFTLELP